MEISAREEGRVCAVVVTYNRKTVLRRCLTALLSQTCPVAKILIVDNGSTDGTEDLVKSDFAANQSISYLNLGDNLGGGGGFHHGARLAFEAGYDWIWLMDDDCIASDNCLEALLKGVERRENIYSPVVLSIEDRKSVLWGIEIEVNSGNHEVTTLPFNGFFIHRESIKTLGLPDKRFFIYGDDTEYNLRAKRSGKKIIMVSDSIMYHPFKNMIRGFQITRTFLNKLWLYYKLRNAIIIYKKYGYVSVNQMLMFMGSAVFLMLTLRFDLLRLWIDGFHDGIRNKLYVRRIW